MNYKDNYIGKDQPDVLDLEVIQNTPKTKEYLPFNTYDLVQCGYPLPDHGEMIIRPFGGTDKDGKLLPGNGMWCKVEDVLKFMDL